jgi:glycosyltransferase involved in cell wall biosynthesis
MAELLTNARARAEIVERGASVLARYDWELTAGQTLKVLEEAAIGR